MKYIWILLLLLIPLGMCVRASDDDDKKEDRDEVPDFSSLDEYIYTPKSNSTIGMRIVSGVKTSFKGNATILAPEATPDATAANVSRTYHDGLISPDARSLSVDNGNGTSSNVPITPDGKTNTWGYESSTQVTPDDYMQMHIYSAVTDDNTVHSQDARSTSGLELTSSRDMGTFGKHVAWSIQTGFSLNDIQSSMASAVNSNVTTLTDTYNLFGQLPPQGPYNAPSTENQDLTNSAGVVVSDSFGNPVQQSVDTSVLLGNAPLNRTITTAADTTSVVDHWKLHGAYTMFRVGPALTYNFTDHLKLTFTAGPALIYASTNYQVTAVLTPETGNQIIDQIEDTDYKIMPAVYADATLEYDLTDRAGFYFGAFYQDGGSYNQSVNGETDSTLGQNGNPNSIPSNSNFSTHVDFSGQQGFRTGVSFKF